jgi:hypothetical protein
MGDLQATSVYSNYGPRCVFVVRNLESRYFSLRDMFPSRLKREPLKDFPHEACNKLLIASRRYLKGRIVYQASPQSSQRHQAELRIAL